MGAGGEAVGNFTSNTFVGDRGISFTSRMSISLKGIDEHTGRSDHSTPEHVSDGRSTGIRRMTYLYLVEGFRTYIQSVLGGTP